MRISDWSSDVCSSDLPDDGRVISNLVCQALSGDAITIYGDGSQTRSFCFVSDMVDGLIRLMEAPLSDMAPVNLGNQIGRASCRARVCQYVSISWVAVSFKKKEKNKQSTIKTQQ